MILYEDVSYLILRVTEKIVGPYNESIYAGDYIRNGKGYWYRMEPNYGELYRVGHQSQVKKLEKLVLSSSG